MSEKVLQGARDSLSSAKKDELLSNMCVALSETLAASKHVQDRVLLDFSRLTSKLIYDGLYDGIPEKYAALAEEIDDYWRYDAAGDEDRERCLSYTRLYQITSMIRIFERERRHIRVLSDLAEKNQQHYELLKLVNNKPNITHKEICEKLSLTSSALSHRMTQLEGQGLIDSRRLGKNKFYSLSFSGMHLFRHLDETDKAAERLWTWKRMFAMSKVLEKMAFLCRNGGGISSDSVLRLLHGMDRWDDSIVSSKVNEWQVSNIDYGYQNIHMVAERFEWNNRAHVDMENTLVVVAD